MSVTSHVLNNATNIDKAYAAMGLPNPSAAELGFLLAEDTAQNDDVVVQDIIADPNVQNIVLPVLEMFTLAFGHAPTQATLAAIISNNITVTAGQPSLNLTSIATAFIESSTFASLYNGGVNITNVNAPVSSTIVTDLFINGLGHPPSASTLAGFNGLTILQAFQAFVQSSVTSIPSVVASVDSYLTGVIDIAAGVPANAPPPPPTQSFTLTVGQDSVVSGVNTIGTTAPGTLVQSSGNVTVNAPLTGIFGNQNSLTSGDVIQLAGLANSLNAGFHGSSTLTGMTIQGAQTWNINQSGGGTVSIAGIPGALDGIKSLNYTGDGTGVSTLQVGTAGAGFDAMTAANNFNLSVSNPGPVSNVYLWFAPISFSSNDTINVTANAVGNAPGGTSTTWANSTFIQAGSPTAGFANWVVKSTGANAVNDIALGTGGSTAAKTLTVTDDGASPTVIWAEFSEAQWAGLTTIDASGTNSALWITGGESAQGLLGADTIALTKVVGGGGVDLFDLSAYAGSTTQVKGLTIAGGVNTTIELSNAETNVISGVAQNAFLQWTNVAALDIVASLTPAVFGGVGVGGTINMADFGGTLTVNLLSSSSGLNPDQRANIQVTNAPDGLNFNFNDTNQHGFNFSAAAAASVTSGGTLNVNYMDLVSSGGSFSSQGFNSVNINLAGAASNGGETFYFGGTTAIANNDAMETLTINAGLTHTGGMSIFVGNIGPVGLGGAPDIELLGGGLHIVPPVAQFNLTGELDIKGSDNVTIGVTNASTIHSTTTGAFVMNTPDDVTLSAPGTLWIAGTGVTATSTSAFSTLQGTYTGNGTGTGTDTLTDLAGHSSFYGLGGHGDTINIGGGNNDVHIGSGLDGGGEFTQLIETSTGHAATGWWGATSEGQAIAAFAGGGSIFGGAQFGGTQADMATVNGFTIGTGGDNLSINPLAFSTLVDANAPTTTAVPFGSTAASHTFAAGFAGETIGTSAYLVLDEINQANTAANLAAALATETVGNINLGHTIAIGATVDILVAYEAVGGGSINIADVELHNGSAAATSDTGHMQVYAQDLVHLAGISFGLTALGINAGEVHFS